MDGLAAYKLQSAARKLSLSPSLALLLSKYIAPSPCSSVLLVVVYLVVPARLAVSLTSLQCNSSELINRPAPALKALWSNEAFDLVFTGCLHQIKDS